MVTKEEYNLPVMIGPAARLALIDYSAKYRVSNLYALHQCYLKTLRSEGFLSEADYDDAMGIFSETLEMKAQKNRNRPLTKEQLKEQDRLLTLRQRYVQAIKEWPYLTPQLKEQWLSHAEKDKDKIPEAKQLLEKIITSKVGVT